MWGGGGGGYYHNTTHLFPHFKVHMPSIDKCNICSLLTLQQITVKLGIHQKRAE